jgi:hypothetical protein
MKINSFPFPRTIISNSKFPKTPQSKLNKKSTNQLSSYKNTTKIQSELNK